MSKCFFLMLSTISHMSIRHDLGLNRLIWRLVFGPACHQPCTDVTLSYRTNLVKYSVKKMDVKQWVKQKRCIISGFREWKKSIWFTVAATLKLFLKMYNLSYLVFCWFKYNLQPLLMALYSKGWTEQKVKRDGRDC